MAEAETEVDITRKRKEISSVSDLDTSGTVFSPQNQSQSKKSRRKKKKDTNSSSTEVTQGGVQEDEQTEIDSKSMKEIERKQGKETPCFTEITKQLTEINKKLSKVITKDDGFLREVIREIFAQMKEEFLSSVTNRIEILEGRLFEKDEENEKLKKESEKLKKDAETLKNDLNAHKTELTKQTLEKERLQEKIDSLEESIQLTIDAKMNELEQYSRRNNIRINGIPEVGTEDAETTTIKVTEVLNDKIEGLELREEHIDISHRIGKRRKDKPRQIIVKFNSRMQRDKVLKNRKVFKGTDVFISEDLTKINQHVLACVRRKMPDEVDQSWSIGGRLFYRPKSNKDSVIEVQYKDFQSWIDLPWPKSEDDK